MKKEALEKIRIARIIKGYSQDYLARELKITQSQYSRLESGKYKLESSRLSVICEILELQSNSLLVN